MENAPGLFVDDDSVSDLDFAQDHSKTSSVVTWEAYSPTLPGPDTLQRSKSGRMGKENAGKIEITPGNFEPNNYVKFLVIKMKEGQQMRDLDMFSVNREIRRRCRIEPKISFMNDGSLLVEVSSPEDSTQVQSISFLAGHQVECVNHKRLNQVRGVIRSIELLRYPEEKIQMELKDQGVVDVKQMKNIGGVLTPLPTYVLTFDRLKLPNIILAAWLRLTVRPYIPSCRRCFYCQKFGHVIGTCRRKMKGETAICENCGLEAHGECTSPPHCVNCSENHPASSKKCDKFTFEKEVQSLRAKEHLSFKEARQRVSSMFIRPGVSFSSIINKDKPSNNQIPHTSRGASMHAKSGNSEIVTKNRYAKRRLSDEREDSLSSKIRLANSFNLLNDELDLEDRNSSLTHTINKVSPSVPACPVSRAGTSVSACAPVQAGTSVSACAPDQAGTSVLACTSVGAGTSVSVCTSVQAENSVSDCALVQSETTISDNNLMQSDTSILDDAVAQAEMSSISACVDSVSKPIGELDQNKSSSQEQLESVTSSLSEKEDILPSLEDKKSSDKAKANSSTGTGALSKSMASVPKEQRAHNNFRRKLKMPDKDKTSTEKDENMKGPSLRKTKVSSK